MKNLDQKTERENVITLMNELLQDIIKVHKFELSDGINIELSDEGNIVDNLYSIIYFILNDTVEDFSDSSYGIKIIDLVEKGYMININDIRLIVAEKYLPILKYVESGEENKIYVSEYL